jgi:hypothetical protein
MGKIRIRDVYIPDPQHCLFFFFFKFVFQLTSISCRVWTTWLKTFCPFLTRGHCAQQSKSARNGTGSSQKVTSFALSRVSDPDPDWIRSGKLIRIRIAYNPGYKCRGFGLIDRFSSRFFFFLKLSLGSVQHTLVFILLEQEL